MWHYFQSPIGLVQCEVTSDKLITACRPLEGDLPQGISLHTEKALLPELAKSIKTLRSAPIGYKIEQDKPAFAPDFWTVLTQIPFGSLVTYGELAILLGLTKGYARAVGNWLGRNECFLLCPCHRVVGANGSLGGFRWGRERKQQLITYERNATA